MALIRWENSVGRLQGSGFTPNIRLTTWNRIPWQRWDYVEWSRLGTSDPSDPLVRNPGRWAIPHIPPNESLQAAILLGYDGGTWPA